MNTSYSYAPCMVFAIHNLTNELVHPITSSMYHHTLHSSSHPNKKLGSALMRLDAHILRDTDEATALLSPLCVDIDDMSCSSA